MLHSISMSGSPDCLRSSPACGPSHSAGCCLQEYAEVAAQNIGASPACLHRPPTMWSAGTPLDTLVVINVALQQSLAVFIMQILHVAILCQQRLYLGQGISRDVQQQQRSGSIQKQLEMNSVAGRSQCSAAKAAHIWQHPDIAREHAMPRHGLDVLSSRTGHLAALKQRSRDHADRRPPNGKHEAHLLLITDGVALVLHALNAAAVPLRNLHSEVPPPAVVAEEVPTLHCRDLCRLTATEAALAVHWPRWHRCAAACA